MISQIAKSENVARIVPLVRSPKNEELFTKLGIHSIVSVTGTNVKGIKNILYTGGDERIIAQLGQGDVQIIQQPISEKSPLIGRQASIPNAVIATIYRNGELIIPTPETIMEQGDVILVQEDYEMATQQKVSDLNMDSNAAMLQGALAEEDSVQVVRLRTAREKLGEQKKEMGRQFDNLTVYAPFDGILSHSLEQFENTYLDQGEEVGRLIDPSIYQATFDVPEREFEGMSDGMMAYLILDVKPWKIFEGTVEKISPMHSLKGLERVYRVTVTFPNESQTLRAGLQGQVSMKTGSFTLPQRILRWFRKTIRLDLQI